MAAIIAVVTALFAKIPGIIGDYFKAKHELAKLKVTTESDLEIAKQNAASQIAVAEAHKARETLGATGKKFKYFTFILFAVPFVLGIFLPSYAAILFHNLGLMPEWYVQSFITILFTIWGIAIGAPVISNIFSGLGRFFQTQRQFKLEKILADKKAFFDALRTVQGYVSGDDVKNIDKVFEKLSKK